MYKIMGGDQREYGPVTSEQIRDWLAQGRANGQTLASFEGAPWKPLSTFPEFADALRTAAPPTIPPGTYASSGYPRSNNLAITGLILSAIVCCPPLSLVGLVLCTIGLSQILKNPEAYTTSKIVPIIGIVVSLLFMIGQIIAFATGAVDVEEFMRNMPR